MRLKDKVAIVVGGGQQPGETMGNGRAVALRFGQECATVLVVDKDIASAQDTVAMIADAGGTASAFEADITDEESCRAMAAACVDRYGRIDILHNNVGMSLGDRPTPEMDMEVWDRLFDMNLKGMVMTCKHVLPVMRDQRAGVILNVSSTSSISARWEQNARSGVAYKTSKGAVNTLTHHLAIENAEYGIRANAILPGLMDTPMAIERRARERNIDREEVRRERNARVPLLGRMGTAWDVANAALFLASDEAGYVTGLIMPVDGGLTSVRG
ncbi:SDR family NAD(P)-dependent oxidoreductase [Thalassobaculum salexigens]|uniref:SDR family NAD(P)-dependent oxidoreductase n=1 Tax=Thalassobaculum salexigens TaxID=455360 RepID=UPI000421DC0E|nr:SDR family oxidoreductase [Thalassobaculum salexigens]